MRRLIAIVGTTATGKTAVGEAVARAIGGAVVCADARQVFRELEIGTGRPTPAERASQPHFMFDLWSLGERATAGAWARAAAETCERLFADGRTPVLVGGSGLYLSALQLGLHPEPPKDAAMRAALEAECEVIGSAGMHAKLAVLDADAAERLAPRDRQRILRALEIVQVGGKPLAWWREQPREAPLAAEWRSFELTCEPTTLAARIHQRTAEMWAAGLEQETAALVAVGLEPALRTLAAIGYDEALNVLAGQLDRGVAQQRMSERTRQMAKRQRTWFRHQMESEALEISAPGGLEQATDRILEASSGR